MRIRWASTASRDLHGLWEYLREHNPRAAISTIRRIESVTRILAQQPRAGRTGRQAGTHELVVTRTSYVAVYRIHAAEVEIVRILHGARQWPPEP